MRFAVYFTRKKKKQQGSLGNIFERVSELGRGGGGGRGGPRGFKKKV